MLVITGAGSSHVLIASPERDIGCVHVRPAEPPDANAVAGIHVRSWQVAYRGLLPDEYLDGLRPEDRARRYTFGDHGPGQPYTMVALDGGTIRGFATVAPARDDDVRDHGELCALYVDPSCWSAGVGRVLMTAARAHLVENGFTHAVLWVLAGNDRARRFYEADGWAPDGSRRINEVWGGLCRRGPLSMSAGLSPVADDNDRLSVSA